VYLWVLIIKKQEDLVSSILKVNNLEVLYNNIILVLKGLSLEVNKGTIVALLGSNGAGKSTTLKAISGFLPLEDGAITDGTIHYLGESLSGLAPHKIVQKGIFQVMEGRRVFEDLTVEENLICGAYTQKNRAQIARDMDKCFEYFPILKQRYKRLAGYLSGGEQQMLVISRALLSTPTLMMLDEPSMGLAPMLVEEIFEIIKKINEKEGTAILLVEQNAQMALEISTYGYIMENGRIVLDGPVDLLLGDRDVQEFYLGMGHGDEDTSYRNVKHYKRRKRWLS
jgi:branched-chain amino acid transport system ATP-binding protein